MILVVAELAAGNLSKATLECVQAARTVGREGPVTLLVLGSGISAAAQQATRFSDQVLVADMPGLSDYDPQLWSAAVAQIAKEGEAHTILVPAGRSGREFSARVAVRLDCALLEDVVALYDDAGVLTAQRYTYLGRVTETLRAESPVAVVSVKPGAFEPAQPLVNAAEQFDVDLELSTSAVRVLERTKEKASGVSLAEATTVVAGGRGVGSAEGFAKLIEPLAQKLGAAIGATRAVVDAGWRPYAEQVGQTGKTVQPALYVAIGISGAVQHLSGMSKSRIIVAINKDADAPIFKEADFGIVGDVQQIVPALIAQLSSS